MIAFRKGNSKIWLRHAVFQVAYYYHISFELHAKTAEEIDLEKCNFANSKLRDLDIDLGSARGHTGGHLRSRSTHTQNLIEIGKTFCGRRDGWTDGRTDGRTDTLHFQSIRSSPGDDLKMKNIVKILIENE